MGYAVELTKEMLLEMGFYALEKDGDIWTIRRYWYKNNSKKK